MFQFNNKNQIVLDPNIISLPFLKVIWEADKTKGKEEAVKSLSYIFYLMDNKSPYAGYPIEKRRENIIKDIIKDVKWKESEALTEAIQKYKEYSATMSSDLLESTKGLIYRLGEYFKTLKFDPNGDPEFELKKATAVQKATNDIGKTIESLAALEERVRKEITQKTTVRGGQTLGMFTE